MFHIPNEGKNFNPLPHARGDQRFARRHPQPRISIHSLMRGETREHGARHHCGRAFQSTPSCEGRQQWICDEVDFGKFQSTPSCEGRRRRACRPPRSFGFQSTPSCEGRQHKPPKIHPDLRQLTQQNHDTPLFGALQAPFFAAQSPIFGVRSPRESHDSFTFARPSAGRGITP